MKITIQRGEIKAAVAGFSKIISSKTNLPVLASVRIEVSNGTVTAEATDLDQVARYQFANAEADQDGAFLIPFQFLKDLSKGADPELIDLQADEGDDILVTNRPGSHQVTQTVAGLPVADWPPCGDAIKTAPADQFLPTYRRCVPFASVDQTRRVLSGILIDLEGKGDHRATLVATDGRRLTCCNSLDLPLKTGLIVPVTKFLTWTGLGDDCSIGSADQMKVGWFGLQAAKWTYRAKLVEGVYPNWRQVLGYTDEHDEKISFADHDAVALKNLLANLPGGDGITVVCAPDGRVSLAGRNAGDKTDTSVSLTDTRYSGPGARLQLNRFYLLDALAAGFRNFCFRDTGSPVRAEDGKGGTHVLMPLRVGASAPVQATEASTKAAAAAPEQDAAQVTTETSTPEAETPPPEFKKEPTMSEKTEQKTETALESLQAAFEATKAKIREANQALADMAEAIKLTIREDRVRRTEVETVRAGLAKLRAIDV